jgi:hypothetical protein
MARTIQKVKKRKNTRRRKMHGRISPDHRSFMFLLHCLIRSRNTPTTNILNIPSTLSTLNTL